MSSLNFTLFLHKIVHNVRPGELDCTQSNK
uniref:Uncharacterized protein n=1 Tax=Mammaliicoccus phage MSShimriz1 TaxID=3230127 RepID=A0AAU8GVV7_9VIRU